MINANPIGCASDESPVSQNEVGLRLPRWSPSSSHKRSIKHDESGPGGNEADDFWHFRLRDGEFETEPEITNGGRRSITSLVPLKYKHLNIRWPRRLKCLFFWGIFFFSARSWERRMFWGVFLTADWQLPYEQGSICQHPIWRTAEPLGDGPHGPGMTKLRGCSQPSLGAWPFRVIDPRSKRHFLRGDLWRRWHGRTLVKGLRSQNKYLSFACRDHNQCHFNYPLQQTHTQLLFQANSLRLTISLFFIFHRINIFFTQ